MARSQGRLSVTIALNVFRSTARNDPSRSAANVSSVGVAIPATAVALVAGVSVSLLRLSPQVLIICAIGLALLMPVLIRAAMAGFDPFEPCFIFGLSYGVMFVVRPAAIWASQNFTDTISGVGVGFRSTFTKMLVLGLIGAVAFGVGYLSTSGRRFAAAMPSPPSRSDTRSLLRLANAFGILGCLLFVIFVSSSGFSSGIHLLLAGRSLALVNVYRSSSSYFSNGQFLLIPTIIIMLAVGFRDRRPKTIALGLMWLGLFLRVQIPLGDRSILLPLAGGMLILPYLAKRKRPRLATLVVLGFLAVFGSAVLVGSRGAAPQTPGAAPQKQGIAANATDLWDHPSKIFQPILKGGDGAEAPDLAAALTVVPSRIGYTWGASTVGDFFTRTIPRALWPGKPPIPRARVINLLWGQEYYLGVANPEFSVLLYPYMDAGVPGVVLMMLLFGAGARVAYEYLRRHADNFAVTLTYAVALPVVVMAVRDSPVDIAAHCAFFVLPLIIAFWLSSVRDSPALSEAPSAPDDSALRSLATAHPSTPQSRPTVLAP